MATSKVNRWTPVAGDGKLIDFDRGGNGAAAPYDYNIMAGCVITGVGTPTVTIASGQVKAGGILTKYNGDTYPTPNKSVTEYLYWEVTLTKNAAEKVIGYSADFKLNAADAASASTVDFAIKIAEIAIGVANITAIDIGENDIWHPYLRKRIHPGDFRTHDPANPEAFGYDGNVPYVTAAGAATELSGSITIPQGLKAVLMNVENSVADVLTVYAGTIFGAARVSLGAGNCNTVLDITDDDADAINFIWAEITNCNGHFVTGGDVRMELIST